MRGRKFDYLQADRSFLFPPSSECLWQKSLPKIKQETRKREDEETNTNKSRQIHRTLKTRENNNNLKKKRSRLWPFFVFACVRKITRTVRQLSGRAFLGGEN